MSALPPRKQSFLDMLAGRAKAVGREAAPTPVADGAEEAAGTEAGAGAAEPDPPASAAPAPADEMVTAPATYDWQDDPEAVAKVQATDPSLMDLGVDAQAQGTVMALQTILNRIGAAGHDLETLGYQQQADDLTPIVESIVAEHDRLMGELEQRGRERRGEE